MRSRTLAASLAVALLIILTSAISVLAAPNKSQGRTDPPRRLSGDHSWYEECWINNHGGMSDMSMGDCSSMMLMGPGSTMMDQAPQ